jgi:hypothetical protein
MNHPEWGEFSFAEGLKVPSLIGLAQLACKSVNDLEHVINVLLNEGSEEAEVIAERLFDLNA